MTALRGPSEPTMRASLLRLALTALVAVAVLSPAAAQSARSGIHVEYTALDTQGGLAGRAFLPMSSRDVSVGERRPCADALQLRAIAKQTRGAVREIAITLVVRAPTTLPITATACPGAFVDTTLEDGSVLSGGRGDVTVTSLVRAGRAPGFVTGTFAQTAMRNGTPVTIRGDFRIPLPPAPPRVSPGIMMGDS